MEQRPLRVGDNVDDYCPRERRMTNHVIVALVGTAIRQTRCSTCEAEHVFKAGRPPRHRKRDGEAEVDPANAPPPASLSDHDPDHNLVIAAAPVDAVDTAASASDATPDEHWSAHRRLIRATLPRTAGDQPPPRPIPEFTMHQRNVRGAHAFRQGQPWHDRPSDAGRGGFRSGASNGNGGGNGNGQGPGANQGYGRGRPGGQGGGQQRRGPGKPGRAR